MKIVIYSDGASRGNPGPGGFGTILISEGNHYKELSGGFRKTTNNRMELLGVITGLRALKKPSEVLVFSDSKYVVDAVEKGWLRKWVQTGFKKKKNADLWRQYLQAARPHRVKFEWVKGHDGNKFNERCDKLAVKAAQQKDLPADEGYESGAATLL